MFAVIRLVQDLGTAWHVVNATRPVHTTEALQRAATIASEYRLDPRIVDAIWTYPRMPLTIMHAFWCWPDKVLDIRPLDPAVLVRHYRVHGDEVRYVEHETEVGNYSAARYAPLGKVAELEPYGVDRFFNSGAAR